MTNQFFQNGDDCNQLDGANYDSCIDKQYVSKDSPTVKFALRMAVCAVVVAISWTFSRVVSKVLEDD